MFWFQRCYQGTMKSGEVFPNAPLALAAVEVRFPPVSDRSLGIAVHRQIREHLGTDWIIQNDTSQIFEAGLGPGGPQSSLRSETIVRISSRSKTKIITVRPDNFTIEVADYLHYADFRGLLSTVAAAVERVLQPDGVSRIGLRYIDEISVPGSGGFTLR